MPTQEGIRQLNAKIIGWCNYYRIGASKRTFSALDQWMWIRQRRYLYRRHPNKHWWWRRKHYLGKIPGREDYSVFMDKSTGGFLWKHAWTKIQRHWLVPKNASPTIRNCVTIGVIGRHVNSLLFTVSKLTSISDRKVIVLSVIKSWTMVNNCMFIIFSLKLKGVTTSWLI
nr:group II intron maturase-specific domain-containing protein [Candidatus Hamiltonella defensa]